LIAVCPFPLGIILCQVKEQSSMVREVLYELAVEIAFLLVGAGHSCTPATLTRSMATWLWEMTMPRYSTLVCSNSHLSGQGYRWCHSSHSRTCLVTFWCSSNVLVKMRMSLRYTTMTLIHHGLEGGQAVCESKKHD
jgi:hypothetical protein